MRNRVTRDLHVCASAMVMALLLTTSLGAAKHDYVEALHKTTFFLGAQRCGDTKSWIHEACHTNDGERDGVDLSGGWHDCGDHIKFAQTNSFAAASMLQMYDRFPKGYHDRYSQAFSSPPKNSIPDILDEVKIFTDYLIKAIKDGRVYYQVGNSSDHNNFAEPAWQSENANSNSGGGLRVSYSVTSGASNYCGSAAATLALMAMNYKKYDAVYAEQCLKKAKEYYAVGAINPKSQPDAESQFYKQVGPWQDDMALGAICLYRATEEAQYLSDAESYYSQVKIMPTFSVLSYTNIGPLAAYELYKVTNKQSYYTHLSQEFSLMQERVTHCDYAHFSDWGSLKYTTASAQVAFLYHDLSNDPEAYKFGKMNVDFTLGSHIDLGEDAPENFSFVIGYDELGGGSPKYPQHCAAFGQTQNAWSFFSQESNNPGSVPFAHELTGALVGGPTTECGGYEDNINNYQANEVCTYYNAHIIGALAYIIVEEGLTPVLPVKSSQNFTPLHKNKITLQQFTVPGQKGQKISVKIYNAQGKLLSSVVAEAGKRLNLSQDFSLSEGAYFMQTELHKK